MGRNRIDSSTVQDDPRREEMMEWLAGIDEFADGVVTRASTDASFRRYFRVTAGAQSRIIMDAPPSREDCRPFVKIAGYLARIGVNCPKVLAADLERGFLLLTDLGTRLYLDELRGRPQIAGHLYTDALQALLKIQQEGRQFQTTLPDYDSVLLHAELALFRDWLCGRHLEIEFSAADEIDWHSCCEFLVRNVLQQPVVFVHRDYHSRNLLVTERENPGIVDFQDAVNGPLTYDLVSLLKDCYIRWPTEQVHAWALTFYSSLDGSVYGDLDAAAFFRHFELMGAQRHLKAAGIFARLLHRDGKSSYLRDVPRTLEYITEISPRYEELAFLGQLINERCLPRLREQI
ncbi:MAG: phosphotransferase [Woeseia sp.]